MHATKIHSTKTPPPVNRAIAMTSSRLFAGIELAVLTLLFAATIWGPLIRGVTLWNFGAAVLFFATILCSAIVRRHSGRQSGFRLDNLASGLRTIGIIVFCVGVVTTALTAMLEVSIEPVSVGIVSGRMLSGFFQEALFLGYFFQRWQALLEKPVPAACANAIWFGLIHAPDPALVGVATFGGFLFNGLFLRIRNVYAIGLGHGLLSLLVLPMLASSNVMATARFGPPVLGKFAERLMIELKPGERIGICSRFLIADQFGLRFDREVGRILRSVPDEKSAREAIKKFFAANERVFCVTTEQEWRHYVDLDLQQRLFVLADNYVWKDLKRMAFRDEGVSGFFRDRVLLVSNHPSI